MQIRAPSGRVFTSTDLETLRLMNECGFIRRSEQPFKLKSGIESHVYVFGREDLTDHPELEMAFGREILDATDPGITTHKQICLIGIPTAGTVLAQAAAMRSCGYWAKPACHRLMREVKKGHGAHQTWVNGKPDPERHCYCLIDNVATNGDSKIETAKKLEEDGYLPYQMPVIILVDRQQGAVQRLTQAGFQKIIVVYNLLDITYAYSRLGLWPPEMVKAVEDEIRAHQVAAQP